MGVYYLLNIELNVIIFLQEFYVVIFFWQQNNVCTYGM